MPRNTISLSKKIQIVEYAEDAGCIRATADHFSTYYLNIQPSQIRRWRKRIHLIREAHEHTKGKKTVHMANGTPHEALENNVYVWILKLRQKNVAISTKFIIAKALSLDPTFKNRNEIVLRRWVYRFLRRYNLSIRRSTHVGQRSEHVLDTRGAEYVKQLNEKFRAGNIYSRAYREEMVNMDQTAIYFESVPPTTVAKRGSNSVSIRKCNDTNQRATLCISVASCGHKLPLFIIFKAKPDKTIEKQIENILPDGMFGCCQENAWMDERCMNLWFEKIWLPYVQNKSATVLILDDFKCHKQESTNFMFNSVGTHIEIIPGGFTSKVQPVDVGIVRPFKINVQDKYMEYMIDFFNSSGFEELPPSPTREMISSWIFAAWNNVDTYTVFRAFRHIGYSI